MARDAVPPMELAAYVRDRDEVTSLFEEILLAED